MRQTLEKLPSSFWQRLSCLLLMTWHEIQDWSNCAQTMHRVVILCQLYEIPCLVLCWRQASHCFSIQNWAHGIWVLLSMASISSTLHTTENYEIMEPSNVSELAKQPLNVPPTVELTFTESDIPQCSPSREFSECQDKQKEGRDHLMEMMVIAPW